MYWQSACAVSTAAANLRLHGLKRRSAFAPGSKRADVAQVRIARSAEADLLEGYVFYERQQAGVGDYFLDSVYADIDALALYAGIHHGARWLIAMFWLGQLKPGTCS